MGWISSLFGCGGSEGRFRSSTEQAALLVKQREMTPHTLEQLRAYGVTPASKRKLEYFFYTDKEAKAASLQRALHDLGYSSELDRATSKDGTILVTGWTDAMSMDDSIVVGWVEKMCRLGSDHDAEFDGWGTHPQDP
jgi:regulator of RNase E activity RraB